MLIRSDDQGWLLISQPMHAEVSAQLARAWGSEQFGALVPHDAVTLGAQLHDIGWVEWERNPTFNAETGLPYTFLELPLSAHLTMWGIAAPSALAFGRYPALLTSLHGTNLYQNRDLAKLPEVDADGVRDFLSSQAEFQHDVLASLAADPYWVAFTDPIIVRRNQRLLANWDAISLTLCGGLRGPRAFGHVPTQNDEVEVTFTPAADAVVVDPWPFLGASVALTFEARRLYERCTDAAALSRAVADASWETVQIALRPA